MPLEVVDVCDDDGVSGESLIGKAGAMPAFLISTCKYLTLQACGTVDFNCVATLIGRKTANAENSR